MTMSLKAKILQQALQHIPGQSFTLRPLLQSLSSLPPTQASSNTDPKSIIDVLFGSELNARRELVQAWAEEGLKEMLEEGKGSSSKLGSRPQPGHSRQGGEMQVLAEIFARRLEYSSRIGEHLVEVRLFLALYQS
jgi:hypothetical protein